MRQPNLLLITTDQQRADALGCAGHPALSTPHLDRLAREGVRYETAICQGPVCMPSRASWVTGQYPSTHGVWANGVSLEDRADILPRVLQQAGYATAMVGKLHLTPSMSPKQPQDGDFGFERLLLVEGEQPGGYRAWLRATDPEAYARLRHNFPPKRLGDLYTADECLPEALHSTHWITDRALTLWRSRVQHRPFFMHVSYPDPHHPFEAPARFTQAVDPARIPLPVPPPADWTTLPAHFRDLYEGGDPLLTEQRLNEISAEQWQEIRRTYYGMIQFIDEEIGRLLDAVRASGEETWIIFTSDHGELLGDHGLLFKGLFHYDALLRVPLIVSGPSLPARGIVSETPVQEIDLMPTLLRLAGAATPPSCQGRLLPGVLTTEEVVPYDFTLTEQRGPWYTPEMRATTLRSREWKLTLYQPGALGELYDLSNDPQERVNLWQAPEYREIRSALTEALTRRLMDSMPPGGVRSHRA